MPAASGVENAGDYFEVKQGSSELRKLAFTVEDASYSCPDGPSSSLEETGTASCWKGGAGENGWVLLRLYEKALLSFLRVRNRSSSEISISISVRGKRRRDFVEVKRGVGLAHGTRTDVKIGHLPCVYVRVECRRRKTGSGGVSLYELVPVGVPARCVGLFMGPCMEDLTYKSTERLLFGPSLRTSHAPVCHRAVLERLILPPSFLRPAGGAVNPYDPDPVRKGPASTGGSAAHALLHTHRLLSPTPSPGLAPGGEGLRSRHFPPFPDAAAGAAAAAGATSGVHFFRGGRKNELPIDVGRRQGRGGVVSFDEGSSPAAHPYPPRGEENSGGAGAGSNSSAGVGRRGGVPLPYQGMAARASHHPFGHHAHGPVANAAGVAGTPADRNADPGRENESEGRLTAPPLEQQPEPRHAYSRSGNGGGHFFGARTGAGGRRPSGGSVASARPFPVHRWGVEGRDEGGAGVDRSGNLDGLRRPKGIGNKERRKDNFGPDFGYDEARTGGRNSSPYPLGSHSEEEEEEEEEGDSLSNYAGYFRRNHSRDNAGISSGSSERGGVLSGSHRHAAVA
ncbi:unnamed protein product [Ectocarpus sp. 12 AP-2014]